MRSVFAVVLGIWCHLAYADTVAVVGAVIHREGKAEVGTIVFRDGVIVDVGNDVAVPEDAKVIDASGKELTSGLVDAYSTLGLVEVELVSDTNEGDFSEKHSIHAAYRVTDGYNPGSVVIPIVRSGGVTSIVAVPRGGLVSGQSAWLRLKAGVGAAAATEKEVAAMHVTLGEGALAGQEGSRGLAVEKLRELLDDARVYAENRASYHRNQLRSLSASRLDLEALVPVIQGKVPLAVRADREADIRTALRLALELRLRLILVGGTEAWRLAPELARRKVPVIVDPYANLPSSFDRIFVRDDLAAVLSQAGVPVIISTFGASGAHRLRQAAGVAVANGLARGAALAAITSVPAEMFQMKARGVLKVGAKADLIVWSGDPFELSTRVERIFIDGVEQPLGHRQTELFKRYRKVSN